MPSAPLNISKGWVHEGSVDTRSGGRDVRGRGGDDTITGTPFSDALFGGGTVHGGDYLFAYLGTDTTLDGDAHGTYGDIADVSGLSGDETITIDATGVSAGSVTVVLVDIEASYVSGGDGDDVLDASGAIGPVGLDGQAGDDTLIGGLSDDFLDATQGTDSLDGRGGSDWYGVFPAEDAGGFSIPVSVTIADTGSGGVDSLHAFGTDGADSYTVTSTTVSRTNQTVPSTPE